MFTQTDPYRNLAPREARAAQRAHANRGFLAQDVGQHHQLAVSASRDAFLTPLEYRVDNPFVELSEYHQVIQDAVSGIEQLYGTVMQPQDLISVLVERVDEDVGVHYYQSTPWRVVQDRFEIGYELGKWIDEETVPVGTPGARSSNMAYADVAITVRWIPMDQVMQPRPPIRLRQPPRELRRLRAWKDALASKDAALYEYVRKSKSIHLLKNQDALCVPRSLLYLMGRVLNGDLLDAVIMPPLDHWRRLYPSTSYHSWIRQRKGDTFWMSVCLKRFPVQGDGTTSDWLDQVSQWLQIQIVVLALSRQMTVEYQTPVQGEGRLYLVRDQEHVYPVLQLAAFLKGHKYCFRCEHVYTTEHLKCPFRCPRCHQYECDSFGIQSFPIPCLECHRSFATTLCYELHLQQVNEKASSCDRYHFCQECRRGYKVDATNPHVCGLIKCLNCRTYLPMHHPCFMIRKQKKKPLDKILFFDFEAEQTTGIHRATHIVAAYADSEEMHVFRPEGVHGPGDRFCDWLFQMKHEGYTCVAHNGRAYDFYFVLHWGVEHGLRVKNVVYTGTKIRMLHIGTLRFLDSMNFMTMPLSAFTETFGIEEYKKGFFPHGFNRPEHWTYVGTWPPLESYHVQDMRKKTAEECKTFVEEHKNDTFDFEQEIVEYCKSDVQLLKQGCLVFRNSFLDTCDIDPFAYCTIAAACMGYYRSTLMPERTIPILTEEQNAWIRTGFYGGRTNVMCERAESTPELSIEYRDVISLYPWVNATRPYPCGWPTDMTGPWTGVEALQRVEVLIGFAEVDMDPPSSLFHPVLGNRQGGKLVFALQPLKRRVVAHVELHNALRQGYVLKTVYRVLTYPYESTDIFRAYVLQFLKLKQESSGWKKKFLPNGQALSDTSSDVEKETWIAWYAEKEGVQVDKAQVQVNPGRRAISKLCLNSLWGKFGQRPEQQAFSYVQNVEEVQELVDRYMVTEIVPMKLRTPTAMVVYSEFRKNPFQTCLALAAMTTAHARTRLYQALEHVGQRALYCDTDSVIYVWPRQVPDPLPAGQLLGEWTDESEGKPITKFVALGSKAYAYQQEGGKETVRSKGHRLTLASIEQALSYSNFLQCSLEQEHACQVDTRNQITRNKTTLELQNTCPKPKRLRKTLDKGICHNPRIVPFGYTGQIESWNGTHGSELDSLCGRDQFVLGGSAIRECVDDLTRFVVSACQSLERV